MYQNIIITNTSLMKRMHFVFLAIIPMLVISVSCQPADSEYTQSLQEKIDQYREIELTSDLSWLSDSEREIIPVLIAAADIIDEIFWLQSYGPKVQLMELMDVSQAKKYAIINYGPWGRLEGHTAFYEDFGDKPPGARFYPAHMTRGEFDQWDHPDKDNPFTLVQRNEEGALISVPYTEAYAAQNREISLLLKEAAQLADYLPFASYLEKLSEAVVTGNYHDSDKAWMQMKNNNIDLVLRPLSTGEDRLFGYKAAHSCYIVVKDHEWSKQLKRFAGLAPIFQAGLPVPEKYKQEVPAGNSEIFVYDALYYAGHCNAGPKIIALHLPQDPQTASVTGTRSMQLKNVMEAKFSEILSPIAEIMIQPDQLQYISADAFFMLTAFHEIAAPLGISNTINNKGPVSSALREYHGTIDAAVTDLMALYLINQLYTMGELTEKELKEAYVTSFASVMRSSRFGTAGAHGIAGMVRFNFFERENVFTRCQETNTYQVDVKHMIRVVEKILEKMLIIQGDGDYDAARDIIQNNGIMPESLQRDIARINKANIPVDVIFKQGESHLAL